MLCDLGLAYKAAGRLNEAVDCQRQVAQLLPDVAFAHSNLGTALAAAGHGAEALAAFDAAAALAPDQPEVAYNRGNALLGLDRWHDAETAFRHVLSLAPLHRGAQRNLGVALKEQGRLAEAIPLLREAARAQPENPEAEWALALALLADGQWVEGWRAHEARRRIPGFAIRKIDAEPWDGSPLSGRRLLVHAEQGLGDTLQFCRWLRCLGSLDGPVAVLLPDALQPLLASLNAPVEIGPGATRKSDLEAPLSSLPFRCGPAEPFWPGAYLAAEEDRVERWRAALGPHAGPTIAIAWQGNPDYRHDARRSIPLTAFAPLAASPALRFVALQRGRGLEQLASISWCNRVIVPGPAMDGAGAFRDSAAILKTVDLLITSDSAIAHLAGALGVRVWLALCDVPDWRWGLHGQTTPWYPTMRLWRQDAAGDWDGVFHRMAGEIARWTA